MKHPVSISLLLWSALTLLVSAGIGYWWWSGVSWKDPAALVRKKYASTQAIVASPSTAGSTTPTTQPPTVSNLQVQRAPAGEILSALPTDIAEARTGPATENQPAIQVPSAIVSPHYQGALSGLSLPPINLPPVPQALLDQTPPDEKQSTDLTPVLPTLRVSPRRYLFNNLAPEATQAKTVQVKPEDSRDFNPETFAPLGEDLTLALLNNVASNSFEVPVAAAVWDPLYFQGHLLLKIGDKVIGSAQAGKNRDRILVTFSKIILKDGRTLPIQATALSTDGTIGIPGFTVGENLLRTLTPVLLEAVRGFAEVFQDRTETSSSSILGATTQNTLGNDFQTKGIEAGRGALAKISEIISQDLEENRPYILAIAGTRFRARLMQPLDVSQAEYGK